LLNRAARYFPILRELRPHTGVGGSVLDVGSGSVGIGEFWPHPFVGCDVSFAEKPRKPMVPVICSGDNLPFADRSFDAVVASDVMEHVPPESRRRVLCEILRVTGKVAIFAFPCGPAAFELDKKLREEYLFRKMTPPVWLEEHMLYPFPNGELFRNLSIGWEIKIIANESLAFHHWMMRMEMRRFVNHFFQLALIVSPRLIESFLRHADGEPSYRKIFVLARQTQ
jgi:hypothetical protein